MPHPTGKDQNLATRQRLARERGAKMLALYESGLSQKRIGEVLGGISQPAVAHAMATHSAYVPRPRKANGQANTPGKSGRGATEGQASVRNSVL